ncbi:extracellular solute-binding protein [Fertoebacter nigrum]|uniref:Extracellular solute-binding protein n=1 Tax=Fertoeibacter niger TaxID=2656921 RepID=A0A8X8GYE8_9RHOB|nr:extracellular solute-binding protein [Fertoeibacter niger]NUB43691.1 extracellular solute-binding protein [Fertoeibacter niger]
MDVKHTLRYTAALAALLASASLAHADCGIEKGSVRILSNDFLALQLVSAAATACASDTVTVTSNLTAEHKNIQVPALSTNPSSYTIAVVANGSLVPLLNDGLVRPMDDLVAKYGQQLQPNQLIKIDGKVMAIAFMANAQHLMYRKSVLDAAGIAEPKTYEDMVAAAVTLKEKGGIASPLVANFKPGWDLGQEFVNMFSGYGGEFFEPGTANLAINGEAGLKALAMMKAMADTMAPEYMTYDTNSLDPVWTGSGAAMMNMWGSRASAIIDTAGAAPDVAADTVLAAAPTVGGGTIPATTLWWDGFAMAKNITDEDAEASFQAMMAGIAPEVAAANPAAAAWLIKGYEPTPAAVGVFATVAAGAKPYPMLPYMGLLHTALGNNLAEFMQGQESAEQALADVTTAYNTAATEAGFLK